MVREPARAFFEVQGSVSECFDFRSISEAGLGVKAFSPGPFAGDRPLPKPHAPRGDTRYTEVMINWGFIAFAVALGAFAFAAYLMKGAPPSRSSW